MSITLEPISLEAARAALSCEASPDPRFAHDYPTEFSRAVVENAGRGPLGPYFIVRSSDGIIIGEIAGAVLQPPVAEIGYAIVDSAQRRGYATAAVLQFIAAAERVPYVEMLRAHTPLDRPASAAVLRKAEFTAIGLVEDSHEGVRLTVRRWERRLRPVARPEDRALQG